MAESSSQKLETCDRKSTVQFLTRHLCRLRPAVRLWTLQQLQNGHGHTPSGPRHPVFASQAENRSYSARVKATICQAALIISRCRPVSLRRLKYPYPAHASVKPVQGAVHFSSSRGGDPAGSFPRSSSAERILGDSLIVARQHCSSQPVSCLHTCRPGEYRLNGFHCCLNTAPTIRLSRSSHSPEFRLQAVSIRKPGSSALSARTGGRRNVRIITHGLMRMYSTRGILKSMRHLVLYAAPAPALCWQCF